MSLVTSSAVKIKVRNRCRSKDMNENRSSRQACACHHNNNFRVRICNVQQLRGLLFSVNDPIGLMSSVAKPKVLT